MECEIPTDRQRLVDLVETAAHAAHRSGVIWTLEESSDLNANLVRFGAGQGVGDHVNDEVEVVFVGVSGSGTIMVDGEKHVLSAGKLVFVHKGTRRSTLGVSEDFSYLTVHRRRGPLGIGPGP